MARNYLKLFLLSLTVLLNLLLFGAGLHLAWGLYQDDSEALSQRFRQRQSEIEQSLKELAFYYKDYRQHPDVSMRQARAWTKARGLLYASLRTDKGVLLFRLYHKTAVPPVLLAELKERFRAMATEKPELFAKQGWVLERRILKQPPAETKDAPQQRLILEYVWEAPRPAHLSFYFRQIRRLQEWLSSVAGAAALWVAVGLCLTGAWILVISLRGLSRTIYRIREIPLTEDSHRQAAAERPVLYRLETEPSLFERSARTRPHRPKGLTAYEKESLRDFLKKRLARHERLRWDLSGFQTILAPPEVAREELAARDWIRYTGESVFGFLDYDYLDTEALFGRNGIGYEPSLSSWSRSLLERISHIDPEASVTLFLKNRAGKLQALLQKRGHIYLNGESLPAPPEASLLEAAARAGGSLVEHEQGRLWVLLQSAHETTGVLALEQGRAIRNAHETNALIHLAQSYAELLYRLRIFESAICDPETSFGNGLLFERDLLYELRLSKERGLASCLGLLYGGPSTHTDEEDAFSKKAAFFAKNLKEFARDRFRYYRIGSDLVALLGAPLSSGEEKAFLGGLRSLRQQGLLPNFQVGWARPEFHTETPASWFASARDTLYTNSSSKDRKGKPPRKHKKAVDEGARL